VDVSVPSSAWSQEVGVVPPRYKAAVALSGMTAAMTPDVYYAYADAVSGYLTPYAESYAGGAYIFAFEPPPAAVAIDHIYAYGG
jgi:hypothetical protein